MPDFTPLEPVSIEVVATVRIPDHQILLVFNSDEDAVTFADWWAVKGGEEFRKWGNKWRKKLGTKAGQRAIRRMAAERTARPENASETSDSATTDTKRSTESPPGS